MRHSSFLIALLLLCIQHGCIGVPLDAPGYPGDYRYTYHGYIDTGSSASDNTLGRWNITGILTIQIVKESWIFQLSYVFPALYNGHISKMNYSRYNDLPKEAEILQQAFQFYPQTSEIYVAPNDPLWSVNMKRSIASNFYKIYSGKNFEKLIYGDCEVHYDTIDNEHVVKTINHDSCKNIYHMHKSNVRPAPAPKGFKPIQWKTVVEIKPDGDHCYLPLHIHSVSKIIYQAMPSAPNTQHVEQHLEFYKLEKPLELGRIRTDSLTERKQLYYEDELEITHGRHKQETNSKVLIQQYLDAYNKFEKTFKQIPIENRGNTTEDPLEEMFLALYNMPDENGFKELREKIDDKANWEMYSTYVELLPYIGNEQSVKHIYNRIMKADLEATQFYAIKMLATFPAYINQPNENLVESLEGMLNVENIKSNSIRNGRILSFASVAARSYEQSYISEEKFEKYIKLYTDKFLETEKYEQKMIYLLGLINMAEGLSIHSMALIFKNTTILANLRSLALTGFKNTLLTYSNDQIFDTFWPIVQDKKENFDVRVAALDLLLSSDLDKKQFNTILEVYKKYQTNDVYGKHLANYFLSTLESLQNSTAYKDPLGNLATAALEKEHFPILPRSWTTGNYRFSYSDAEPNIGGYVQAKLTANPVLNTLSTVQLSYNNFAWSFDSGEYTVYIKLQGVLEKLYKKLFFTPLPQDMTIPEILDVIKEYGIKLQQCDLDYHIEIVVFVDGRAVFGAYLDNENFLENSKHLANVLQETTSNTFTITFPIRDDIHLPSILGTPIIIKNYMKEVLHFGATLKELMYRKSWNFQTWLNSYNPVLDLTVSSYKYYEDSKALITKEHIKLRYLGVWMINNENNTLNWAWDSLIGTAVNEEDVLHRFCGICEAVKEVPTNSLSYSHSNRVFPMIGMRFNKTLEHNHDSFTPEYDDTNVLVKFQNSHHSNTNTLPFAKPVMIAMHFYNYLYYFQNELQRGFYRSIPLAENGTKTELKINCWRQNTSSWVLDPFENTHITCALRFRMTALNEEEEVINDTTYLYEIISTHNHKDENGKDKVKVTQNFYYYIISVNRTGTMFCSTREDLLPTLRSDKFSILPTEDATMKQILRDDSNLNKNNVKLGECSDNHIAILTGNYATSEARNKAVKESSEYKECLKDSKGLKFTPPSQSCIFSFIASNQYDQYTVRGKVHNMTNIEVEDLADNALFTYSRVGDKKLKFRLLQTPFGGLEVNATNKYVEHIMYFPYQNRNPAAEVYRDNDIIFGLKRSCIVTPNNIQSFTGRNIPTATSKQLAFVECFENAMRGLTTQKISDTQVGFKLWSRNSTVEATVHEDKLKIFLNGQELDDSYLDEHAKIRVRFLDDNVVFIADDTITVYYNTEYIYIKASPIYNDMICGVCSQV